MPQVYFVSGYFSSSLRVMSVFLDEDRFHIQSVFREQSFVFSNPNMALPEAQGWITHSDALQLGNGKRGRDRRISRTIG